MEYFRAFIDTVSLIILFVSPFLFIASLILLLSKKRFPALVLFLTTLFSCSAFCVYSDGYYLPVKPCRPVSYPTGEIVVDKFLHETNEPLDKLLAYYDWRLSAVGSLKAGTGEWGKEQLQDNIYLYSCYAADINGMTSETGCIYVINSIEKDMRVVAAALYRGDLNPPCPRRESDVIKSFYE